MYSVWETLQEQMIKIKVFVILLADEKTPAGVSQSIIPVSVQILILISRSAIYHDVCGRKSQEGHDPAIRGTMLFVPPDISHCTFIFNTSLYFCCT